MTSPLTPDSGADRELLELAAKAAGIEFRSDSLPAGGLLVPVLDHQGTAPELEVWNPLTDDGDALRLAVKLRLLVLPAQSGEIITVDSYTAIDEATENARHDPYAATRRAIVRAAAEIGKAKA
jgi:hypothetical protein